MTRMQWIVGVCLSLMLIGGLALDASAQQPPAPPAPAETKQAPDSSATQPAPQPTPPVPQPEYGGRPAQAPPTDRQIETRAESTERIVEQPGKFLGVDPTVAMVIGAVLVIVIVIGLVAMGRRGEDVRHTRPRHQA
ncbi:MAG: hypothetical protein WEG40_01225 [Candidatus Rokuibacteriota bacterium]